MHPPRLRRLVILAVGCLAVTGLVALPARAATVRYEAENATNVQGVVESNHAGFSAPASSTATTPPARTPSGR